MLKTLNESRRLSLGLALLLGAGFAATGLVSYYVSNDSIVADELPLTVDIVYSEIQHDLIRPIFISSMMAKNTFLQDWVESGERNPDKIVHYLKGIQEHYGTLTAFFASERSRLYYHENGILKKVSENDNHDAWFFRAQTLPTPYEINVDTDEAHRLALTYFINHQVRDRHGHLLGVTGVGLTVNAMRSLIDSYQKRYHRNVFFTDRDGRIVLQSKAPHFTGNNIHDIQGLSEQAGTILKSKEGAYQYRHDQHAYQLNVRFMPELDWYLFVEKAEDEAFADIKRTLVLNLAICALVTILVLLLTSLSIRRYQQRLKRAADYHAAQINQALAETKAANQTRNHMLAFISHDLRTPLTTIIRYASLLNAHGDAAALKYQSAIERSAIHQLALIDDLVEYARGELDDLELLPAPTYLHALLHDIANQGALLADQQCNCFFMSLGETLPPIVIIDPKRLRQILLNLLSNAAKFTQSGEIRMQVEACPISCSGEMLLRFAVTDTGPGIPDEDFERIFLPFERCETSRPGSGLGLAIAGQVVRKMGGELRIGSKIGQGSRFWFEIKSVTAPESAVLQPAAIFAMPEPFGKNKRILVVDDDPINSDYLYEILAMADFDIVLAANGEEALQFEQEHRFDLVLTDQIMPGINGWELLRHLHERHPADAPPVLLYSALPPERPKDFPDHINFHGILLKPIYPDELLNVLRQLLTPKQMSVSTCQ